MSRSDFLLAYAEPDRHYSYDDSPIGYLKHSDQVSSAVLDRATTDANWLVRSVAVQHPNCEKKHIQRGLNDPFIHVRTQARNNPNFIKVFMGMDTR